MILRNWSGRNALADYDAVEDEEAGCKKYRGI